MTRDEAKHLLDTVPGIVIKRDVVVYRKTQRGYEDGWLHVGPNNSHEWSAIPERLALQTHEDGYDVYSRPEPVAPSTPAVVEVTEADIAAYLSASITAQRESLLAGCEPGAMATAYAREMARYVASVRVSTREQTAREIAAWLASLGEHGFENIAKDIEQKWGGK